MNTSKHHQEIFESGESHPKWTAKKLNNKIATILAISSLSALSNSLAETPLQFSAPVKISGPWIEKYNAEPGKSRIFVPYNGTRTDTVSQMTLSISPSQAWPYGGNMTVSGVMRIISGENNANKGVWLAGMIMIIQQQLFHGSGQEIRRMWDSNEGVFLNDSDPVFSSTGEGLDRNVNFSFTVPVSSSGLQYTIRNSAQVGWSDATVMLAGNIDGTEPLKVEYSPYPTNPDENNNGIFDTWEISNFGNADLWANRPEDDPDHDGMSNLEEYAFGKNPLSSSLSPIRYIARSGYSAIFCRKNSQAKNVVYTPEVSTDLQNWSSTSWSLYDLSDENFLEIMDNSDQSESKKRFLRIRIEAK